MMKTRDPKTMPMADAQHSKIHIVVCGLLKRGPHSVVSLLPLNSFQIFGKLVESAQIRLPNWEHVVKISFRNERSKVASIFYRFDQIFLHRVQFLDDSFGFKPIRLKFCGNCFSRFFPSLMIKALPSDTNLNVNLSKPRGNIKDILVRVRSCDNWKSLRKNAAFCYLAQFCSDGIVELLHPAGVRQSLKIDRLAMLSERGSVASLHLANRQDSGKDRGNPADQSLIVVDKAAPRVFLSAEYCGQKKPSDNGHHCSHQNLIPNAIVHPLPLSVALSEWYFRPSEGLAQ